MILMLLSAALSLDARNSVPSEPMGKEERLQWFKDAKFGMFIHWGPYSKLAGEWEGQQLPAGRNAEWIMNYLKIPVERYRDFAHSFNPVRFDANRWSAIAQDAGMKYVVITAKHHDGFAMYDSKVSDYNIVKWTPFRRDPIAELARASRNHDLRFGIYYSHREDWNEPFAYGNTWDFKFDPEKNLEAFERNYVDIKAKPQIRELLSRYGPIALVWFDRGMYTPKQGREFADLVHALQPRTLVSGRVGNYDHDLLGDYQSLRDNGMPVGGIDEYWETPGTLNDTWGYSRFDTQWKSAPEVIERLVRVVSAGGNYLLNVGPTGEGEIPPASVGILTQVGRWLRQNGESIYGTTGSPFPELSWGCVTVKPETLFLHVLRWPANGRLVVPGLRSDVLAAYFLTAATQSLRWERHGSDVVVSLPLRPADSAHSVIVLKISGAPTVDPPVVRQPDNGVIRVDYLTAVTKGGAVKRFNRKGGFHIARWTKPADKADWHVDVIRPGRYEVIIEYAANAEDASGPYVIEIGGQTISATVQATGDWFNYREMKVGDVELAGGRQILCIRPSQPLATSLMYLKSLRLVPLP